MDSLSFILQGKQKLRKSSQKTNHPHCQYQIHSCHETGVNLHININFALSFLHKSQLLSNDHSKIDVDESPFPSPWRVPITKTSFSECHLCRIWQKPSISKTKTSVQLFIIFQPIPATYIHFANMPFDLNRLNLLPNRVSGYFISLG